MKESSLPNTIKLLDFTWPSPAENLAADEFLLNKCEERDGQGMLRFWEPATYFAVLGYANRAEEELNIHYCHENQIPIHRRCSGGGTVLNGPGCLNYSLILKITEDTFTHSIPETNRQVMRQQRDAIQTLQKVPVEIRGHTDLVFQGRKFSGNAQKRGRTHLLFHGTFLLDFKLSLIGEALRIPPKMPDYREGRSHRDFVANLKPISSREIKETLKLTWKVEGTEEEILPIPEALLMKYQSRDWNYKF